ncbi:Putative peptidyl-tRNA hydrolase PTRHD1, partial [Cuculus canorus]
ASPYGNMAAPRPAAVAGLVQYVVLRGDLARPPLAWPLGAGVGPGRHPAPCAPWCWSFDPTDPCPSCAEDSRVGCKAADSISSQAPDEAALRALAETLNQHSIDHALWMEQPENMPTCLALRPYPKDQVHQHLKKFKLLK